MVCVAVLPSLHSMRCLSAWPVSLAAVRSHVALVEMSRKLELVGVQAQYLQVVPLKR